MCVYCDCSWIDIRSYLLGACRNLRTASLPTSLRPVPPPSEVAEPIIAPASRTLTRLSEDKNRIVDELSKQYKEIHPEVSGAYQPMVNWINKRLKKQGMDLTVSFKPISPKPEGSAGILMDQSSDVAIEGNTVVGFDEGIAIQNSIGVVADKNVIKKAKLPE
jgi:parallel beta-helix repeat protein